MNNYYFLFTIVILFNYFIGVYSENANYIVSILRNKNDKSFDIETKSIQLKIEELVNDRMNDIYDIIVQNQESYVLENGKQDQMLNEIETNPLKKRDDKSFKYLFINHRKHNNNFKRSINLSNFDSNSSSNSNSNSTDYIPIESKLVNHICPIKNYYAVNAYLSEVTAEIVCKLPNVLKCEKSFNYKLEEFKFDKKEIKNLNEGEENITMKKYLKKTMNNMNNLNNRDDIKLDNNSTNISNRTITFFPDHLTVLSHANDDDKFDDHVYYYPTSAGHGIDIYFIDTGLNTDHIDFFDYEGFDFNRTVTCDAVIDFNEVHYTTEAEKEFCYGKFDEDTSYYQNPYHGTAVASVAAGMIFGASQKANIHMIAVDLSVISVLRSFDYILLNAKPHKTIINMSFSGGSPYYQANEDKLSELIEKGFILFTSAGNERENCCAPKESEDFHAIAGYRKAITVSAAFSNFRSKGYTMEDFANYGDCVDIFAPGFVAAAYATESRLSYYPMEGTSFSSPLAAGVAATIMSAYPEYEFDNHSMKKVLIDLSHKDVISGLGRTKTPDRFINNGFDQKIDTDLLIPEIKCGSAVISDSEEDAMCYGCCSKEGKCIPFDQSPGEECLIENGCQSEFGFCTTREESIKACEKDLEENKECQIYISNEYSDNDIISCSNFNTLKCSYFYTDLEIGSTCNIAKHFKDFDFVKRFDERTYDRYVEICINEIYYKYKGQCEEEVKDYRKCLFGDDIFELLKKDDINELEEDKIEDLQKLCIDFETDYCVDFRNRSTEIILTHNSCRLVKNLAALDIYHRELFLSEANHDRFVDFCKKVYDYQTPKCDDRLKKYDECLPIFTNTTATTEEFIENCSLIESNKCQSFYEDKNHSIDFCNPYAKNSEKYDLLSNMKETISHYKTICENNVKEEVKEKVISACEKELQNNECIFEYDSDMTDEDISSKCEAFKSEKCQSKYTFSSEDINICKLAQVYSNDKDWESMLLKYEENYSMDNNLCMVSKEEIIAQCNDKLIDYDECLINVNGQNSLYYLCLFYKEEVCQTFYENPYKYVPECKIAERYQLINIINKDDTNYKFLTEQCSYIIEKGIELPRERKN